jgi:hypothetical protein
MGEIYRKNFSSLTLEQIPFPTSNPHEKHRESFKLFNSHLNCHHQSWQEIHCV